ncbi:MAG: Rpn family recombination-promoting nuclease/putative transposase [Magnetococcales bacterium]|nr:Rpn family recombination-promoting nuclease/putative transposase [Magnetococcales bacterium]
MTDLVQPHDKLFKALMSNPETAGALLREHLPQEIVALLACDHPELVKGSFISPELRPYFSDMIFKAKTLSLKDLYFYLLVEHKSFHDRKVAWQLDRGRHRFMEQKEKENPDWLTLPAIIPFVLYHGAQEWTIPTDFLSLVDCDEALRPWLTNFTYALVNIGTIPDDQLSTHARLKAGLLALKYGTRDAQSQMEALDSITRALMEAPELLIPVMIYLLTTFDSLDQNSVQDIVVQVSPQEAPMMQSIYARELIAQYKDTWIQEGLLAGILEGKQEGMLIGKQEGKQEGMLEGMLEGKAEMLLQLLQERFGVIPKSIQEQVTNAGLDDLKAWTSRLFKAESLPAIFQ